MKFTSVGAVEECVWNMRLADLPRGENRAILNRMYNGHPPFDPAEDEENSRQINRSWLEGTNMLSQARRQWNRAFLGTGNYYTVTLDSGPAHKRAEYGHIITRNWNKQLKRNRLMMEQERATGASTMLHGIGPVNWRDRRCPVPSEISISSLMIPSETDINFENVEYFAIFREWTPAQLYNLTHGPKVDPGWNMRAVQGELAYVGAQTQKQPNATAYQYMPERIEELVKQDLGFWGSDAVPTVDIWDFYFREQEDGTGWYRRVFLDWDVGEGDLGSSKTAPTSRNTHLTEQHGGFLYSSGKRKYADRISEIIHCQFGDCSAVAPFKYHSVRSLGWMLWGVCDLQNRLRCQFTESVFEQLMWFFRVSGQESYNRIKKAMFTHMGVIPNGVAFVPANERFKPDMALVSAAIGMNRQIMQENAASYTQDLDEKQQNEMTATETMARVNSVNAMVSGMLNLAYDYAVGKGREIGRRFCIKNSPYKDSRDFRQDCLKEGVPPEMLDAERWDVQPERVMGGGNKTLEIAQANQLQALRKNLPPESQRHVDHIAIEAFTDNPSLAELLAPTQGQKPISRSGHDAQLASDRLLRGLPFTPSPEMVYEEYVQVWLKDLAMMVMRTQKMGGMATPDQLLGFANMAQAIKQFLGIMATNPEDKAKIKQYGDALGKIENLIKAFAQRLQEQMGKQNGQGGGIDPETKAKIAGMMMQAKVKAQNTQQSHAARTAQKQVSYEMQEQRKDRELNADIRRKNIETAQELRHNRMKALTEVMTSAMRTPKEKPPEITE
jgi:hypothetical protein